MIRYVTLSVQCESALTLSAHARRGFGAHAQRVTVVVSCVCVCVCVCVNMYVCVCVCLSAHDILAIRAIKSVTKDTVVLNVRFAAIL